MTHGRTATLAALALAAFAAATAGATAGEAAGKAFTLTTKSEEARKHLREALRAVESFEFPQQIQAHVRKALEADPGFAFAHYLLAATTFPQREGQPHFDKAVELAKAASDGERRYIEAIGHVRAQKPDLALPILQSLEKDYPGERLVQTMIGQVYVNLGKLDLARAAFERAIAIDGSTPRAYFFVGNDHLLRGEYAKAREAYEKALARKAPGTVPPGPHYGIAFTHLYEGDPDAALRRLHAFQEDYVKTRGDAQFPSVFIWNSIARINLENGRLEAAMRAYEKGFESVPGSQLSESDKKLWLGRLHHGRGRVFAKMGRHEEAWKEADTIKRMIDEAGDAGKPYLAAYHYLVGYLKLEAGDAAAAVEHLKQADLADPFQKLLLARAYEKAGDQASAHKAYGEILSFRQNNLERALAYPEAKRKAKAS